MPSGVSLISSRSQALVHLRVEVRYCTVNDQVIINRQIATALYTQIFQVTKARQDM